MPQGAKPGHWMEKSRVLVVIVNYRAANESLGAVAGALAALDGLSGGITVVDAASGNDSARSISAGIAARGQERRVRVLEAGSAVGLAASNNIGICAGLPEGQVPDYIYLLNARARPTPDTIRRLIAHLDARPRTGIVGTSLFGPDGARLPSAFRFPSIRGEFEGAARLGALSRLLPGTSQRMAPPETTRAVDWVCGSSMMLRRGALDEIGLFDEDYRVFYDDADLCRRARAAGWGTDYLFESRVDLHVPPHDSDSIRQRVPQRWMDARLRYFIKNHGRFHAAAATVAHVAGGLVRRLVLAGPRIDPPRFLRNLILHDLGAALRSIWASLRSIMSADPARAPRRARRR